MIRTLLLLALLLAGGTLLSACGKKGPPVAPQPEQTEAGS